MATIISVHARPTKKDIVLARLSVYFDSVFGKAITAASLALPILYLLMGHARPDPALAAPALVALIVSPGAFAFAGINSPTVKNLVEQGQQYIFDETGIETANALGQVRLRWDAITRAHENAERFVLLGPGALIIVPKRSFRDASDVESFRDLVKRRSRFAA